jgi:gas vesicle protein
MNDQPPNEESLRQEFEALGKNLIDALRSAWEAPESKRLRDEMTTGLNDLGSSLKREAEYLASHPATQQMKNDVEHLGEKIRAPEAQAKVRNELIGALQTVNAELQKVIDHWKEAENTGEQPVQDQPAQDTPAEEAPANSQAEQDA